MCGGSQLFPRFGGAVRPGDVRFVGISPQIAGIPNPPSAAVTALWTDPLRPTIPARPPQSHLRAVAETFLAAHRSWRKLVSQAAPGSPACIAQSWGVTGPTCDASNPCLALRINRNRLTRSVGRSTATTTGECGEWILHRACCSTMYGRLRPSGADHEYLLCCDCAANRCTVPTPHHTTTSVVSHMLP